MTRRMLLGLKQRAEALRVVDFERASGESYGHVTPVRALPRLRRAVVTFLPGALCDKRCVA
jgi:hypothetical protein